MSKKESSLERVIGASPEDERAIKEQFKRTFETRQYVGFDEGHSIEKEKSPEMVECINALTRCMHGFLSQYGVGALDIRPDQIHFIDKDKVPPDLARQVGLSEQTLGHFDLGRQWIFIFHDEGQYTRQRTVHAITHEMMHFNSFYSNQINIFENSQGDISGEIKTRRAGLEIGSGDSVHFKDLNEAVTEELALRFGHAYFRGLAYIAEDAEKNLEKVQGQIDRLQQEHDQTEDLDKKWRYASAIKKTETEAIVSHGHECYSAERDVLYKMIEDMFRSNKDQFKNRDEVFELFVRGMLSGRILPLARIIDKTYGSGSFSKLADGMEALDELAA